MAAAVQGKWEGCAVLVAWLPGAGHTARDGRNYVLGLVRKQDAARVNVTVLEERTTGHISPAVSPQFDLIGRAIRETLWPNPPVRPPISMLTGRPAAATQGIWKSCLAKL